MQEERFEIFGASDKNGTFQTSPQSLHNQGMDVDFTIKVTNQSSKIINRNIFSNPELVKKFGSLPTTTITPTFLSEDPISCNLMFNTRSLNYKFSVCITSFTVSNFDKNSTTQVAKLNKGMFIPNVEYNKSYLLLQSKSLFVADDLKLNITLLIHRHIAFNLALQQSDMDFTDYELRGVDGSVYVHKVALAGASPYFKTMLNGGTWQGSIDRSGDFPNATKSTLQHLKDYIYLAALPNEVNDLTKLHLFAASHQMPELAGKCEDELVKALNAKNLYDQIHFAIIYGNKNILKRVLEKLKEEIEIEDLRKYWKYLD